MYASEFVWGLKGLASKPLSGSVVALGAFDGVHLGHQELIKRVKLESQKLGLPSVVIIFEPQPNEFFAKERAPARLMRLREKVSALQVLGVDRVLCLKFNQALRALSPKQFVEDVLVRGLGLKFLVVGDDFRFGSGGGGDYALLQQLGEEFNYEVTDTDSFLLSEKRVSSTLIRESLSQANFANAQVMLGRAYFTLGRVTYGQQLGRTIGFPTLNIALGRKVMALSGVFAVQVELREKMYRGVANIGLRPTVDKQKRASLEVHLLDEDVDAYGEFVRVTYLSKIRDEKKFSDVSELKTQIEKDVAVARDFFARESARER